MIDNLILKQLAKKKLASNRLIKKLIENERKLTGQPKSQVHSKKITRRTSGQIFQQNLNRSLRSFFKVQSETKTLNRKINFVNFKQIQQSTKKMRKLTSYKRFERGFVPENEGTTHRNRTKRRIEKLQG